MRLTAYVLAADPAWIESSVLSYYDFVDEIIVSYDKEKRGWTGAPIPVEECMDRLQAIDRDRKLRYFPGDYSLAGRGALENDTYQRQCALDRASQRADWVLQIDTDEVLPDCQDFVERLRAEVPEEYHAIDWPMRTFFQRTSAGNYLEVCSLTRKQISSYPGPIAVRPETRLVCARQTQAPSWRYDIRSKDTDPAAGNRPVHAVIPESLAIAHLSWLRTEAEIRSKLQSWGHSNDFDWQRYFEKVWKVAPRRWRFLYRFHPFSPKWWPALRSVEIPPGILRIE